MENEFADNNSVSFEENNVPESELYVSSTPTQTSTISKTQSIINEENNVPETESQPSSPILTDTGIEPQENPETSTPSPKTKKSRKKKGRKQTLIPNNDRETTSQTNQTDHEYCKGYNMRNKK